VKTIAIIPARGGSKRIPRKNIKNFLGRPIIAYSIEAALKSKLFDEVMVSTDDEEIAEVARYYGASIPKLRSQENSSDFSTTSDVLNEVLMSYDEDFDYFCCIYPTAPFVTTELLSESFNKLLDTDADSLIPIVEFTYPPQRGLVLQGNTVTMLSPENLNVRSQDLEKIYHDVGQFYWGKVESFMKTQKVLGSNTSYMEISPLRVQDIDNDEDWKLAEIKYHYLNNL
jgi:pseudaminic acid cytidylyltransferase